MKTRCTKRKKFNAILVAIMALCFGNFAAQAQSCSNPDGTAAANWLFNGNLNDASGNGRNLVSSSTPNYSTLNTEGSSSVNVSSQPILQSSDALFGSAFTTKTVSMSIQTNFPNGARQIYDQGDLTNGISLLLSGGNLWLSVADAGILSRCNVPYPTDAEFHQVGFVYDGGTAGEAWLYLDGYPVCGVPANGIAAHTASVGIGTNIGTNGNGNNVLTNTFPFIGLIDDVSVYNSVKSPKQMLDMSDCALSENLLTDLPDAGCPVAGFLVQTGNADWYQVDLVNGTITPGADNNSFGINAQGFNELDGRIWGVLSNASGSRIGLLTVTSANPDGTFTTQLVGPIAGLDVLYNAGDVLDGVLYLTNNLNLPELVAIDVDATSPTYLQILSNTEIATHRAADVAANPVDGKLYGVSNVGELMQIDPQTGVVVNLGPAGTTSSDGDWGAAYFDDQGYFYVSHNSTGVLDRIDLTTNPGSNYDESKTNFFGDGPASTGNDGARCPGPLPIDWGDAPDSYGTLLKDDGPRHSIAGFNSFSSTSPLTFGPLITLESEGQPDTAAALDADDGGTPPTITIADGSLSQTIATYSVDMAVQNTTGEAATACAWIDWNNNGTFDDGERQCVAVPIGATTATFTWTGKTLVGPNKDTGTYARFRITSDATAIDSATGATGSAADGEVEDYFILYTGTLPVELLFFTAEAVGNNAYLTWATATETNNAYFEVQQSIDGVNWTVISEVAGNGTTNTRHDYAYTHNNVSGVVFYRLKQVDDDGTSSYSNIEVLNFASDALRLFPNPANDVLNITLGSGAKNSTRGAERIRDIVIYDMIGRVIQYVDVGDSQSERIDISVLPPAMYMLGITTSDNTIRYEKFVKTNR